MIASAVMGLSEINNPDSLEFFLKFLNDTNRHLRFASASALGNIGDVRAVESLIIALDDEEGGVREVSSISLGKLGDSRAIEPLIAALIDPMMQFVMLLQMHLIK